MQDRGLVASEPTQISEGLVVSAQAAPFVLIDGGS
jgi:hypothetical protein